MPLSKVQLMNVPGGPGDFGAVQQGTGVTINANGEIISQPATVTSLKGGNGLVVTAGPELGDYTISFGGAIPTPLESGSTTYICSSAAPLGWTKVTDAAVNDAAIRVVSGAGGVAGGSAAWSSVFTLLSPTGTVSTTVNVNGTSSPSNWSPTGTLNRGSISVQGTSINLDQTGSHNHNLQCANDGGSGNMEFNEGVAQRQTKNSDGQGGGGSHSHDWNQNQNWNLDSKQHTHPFSIPGQVSGTLQGSNFNLNIKYVDSIMVRRD